MNLVQKKRFYKILIFNSVSLLIVFWFCGVLEVGIRRSEKHSSVDAEEIYGPQSRIPPPDVHSPLYLLELAKYEEIVASALTALETHSSHHFKPELVQKISEYLDDYSNDIKTIEANDTSIIPPVVITDNPIFAFNMLWRFAYNLPSIYELLQPYVDLVNEGEEQDFIKDKITAGTWPKALAVDEAMAGLLRIQMVYNLDSKELSSGIIYGVETGAKMNILQLFELALFARSEKQYTLAIPWLQLAVNNVRADNGDKKRYNISVQKLERILNETMLEHDQEWSNQTTKPYYFYEQKLIVEGVMNQIRVPVRDVEIAKYRGFHNAESDLQFWKLCAGQNQQNISQDPELSCWYDTSDPAFRINPLKIEMLSLSPYIVQFYDVLSEKTAKELVEHSLYAIARPQQASSKSGSKIGTETLVRTSVQAYVNTSLPKLDSSIEAISRLSLGKTSEPILVEAYALGGHFDCHLDAYPRGKANSSGADGLRVATMMFYMEDTIKGGVTVFPKVGVATTPIKGSVVLWSNMMYNGEVDTDSYHCACPVVLGHKTTATKWIQYVDQFQKLPCDLDKNI